MGLFNFFKSGSYESYDEPRTWEEFERQYPRHGSSEGPNSAPAQETCAKCGGSGVFRGSRGYGGGAAYSVRCPQCDGSGRA